MMDSLQRALRPLIERIDALSLRERGMVFVGVLAVLLFAANAVLFAPLRAEQQRLERAVKDKRTESQALEKQLQLLTEGIARDPNAENRTRLEALRARIRQMDEDLGRLVAGFVTPREMAKLVEEALKRNRGLEFVKVENIPPGPVTAGNGVPGGDGAKAEAPKEATVEAAVYKHGLRIEMKGSYRDIVGYLRSLEALPWKVFWGEVALETEVYPVSRVTVVIYTLSRRRGWIGT
jgi:MSHA biogenesis protein MshJ